MCVDDAGSQQSSVAPVLLLHTQGSPLDMTILVGTSPFPITVPHEVILHSPCLKLKCWGLRTGMCLA